MFKIRRTVARRLKARRAGKSASIMFVAGCAVSAGILGLFELIKSQQPASAPQSSSLVTASDSSASKANDEQPDHPTAEAPKTVKKPVVPPSVTLPTLAVSGTADEFDQEALRTAQALADKYPNRAEALHVLALLQAQIRHSAEADKLWRRCVELAPGVDLYLTNLAANAVNRGDSEGAIEVLSKLAAKGKASPDALHNLAASLMNVGRLEEGLKIIEEATAKASGSPAHWLLLGQIQLKLGDVAKAEENIRKAISIGGETSTSCYNLATALQRQGKSEEAAKYRERFQELSKKDPLPADNRYQILSEAESRRNLVTVLVEGGAIYGKTGEALKAESLLLRALALEPREMAAALALADLYQAASMFAEERVARRRILELNPGDPDAYLRLAKASVNAGEPEAGAAVLKNALAIAPDRVDLYASMAQLLMGNHQPEQAVFYAQEALQRQPSREGYMFLSGIWKTLGKDDEAAAAAAKANQK